MVRKDLEQTRKDQRRTTAAGRRGHQSRAKSSKWTMWASICAKSSKMKKKTSIHMCAKRIHLTRSTIFGNIKCRQGKVDGKNIPGDVIFNPPAMPTEDDVIISPKCKTHQPKGQNGINANDVNARGAPPNVRTRISSGTTPCKKKNTQMCGARPPDVRTWISSGKTPCNKGNT